MAREYLDRHVRRRVEDALADTRVVAVLGARQVGKSTLVNAIASGSYSADVLTLDDQATRAAAERDPTDFVAGLATPIVIDEVQRVPDLLLVIKQRVDRNRGPGQFLLTGSANLLTAPSIADALTGRIEYVRLGPFSQGELNGEREAFIPRLFAGDFPRLTGQEVGRRVYAPMIAAGGYPEAVARRPARRARFFEGYLDTILQRDLDSIARVGDPANVGRLLSAFGAISAGELNFDSLSRDLGLASNTLRSYADLLETLFLIRRLPSWSDNRLARVVKRPKVYVADTGLLAHLAVADERRIETDLDLGGSFFETFVAMELARQSEWQDDAVRLHHYRDKEQREVDVVMERRDGSVAAVEVKAAASLARGDARGLTYLRDRLGERFKAGALIYTGEATVPLGDRLAAVPLSGLWTA